MSATTKRSLAMVLYLLGSGVSCGGSSGGATGGAGGSAAGHAGSGGAPGSGGRAGGGASGSAGSAGNGGASGSAGSTGHGGASGSIGVAGNSGASGSAGLAGMGAGVERDAGSTDARATDATADGATTPCAVAVDGGTVACTIQIVSGNDNDLYCGLKADGQVNCWAAEGDGFLFQAAEPWPPAISKAPPNLAQLAMTNSLSGGGGVNAYTLCGVDESGTGACWNGGQPKNMGPGLKAIVLSDFGVCTLGTNGAVTCPSGIASLPATVGYTKILASENAIAALDVAGVPHYRDNSFPAGVYIDIATNDAGRVGAVQIRRDGGDNRRRRQHGDQARIVSPHRSRLRRSGLCAGRVR